MLKSDPKWHDYVMSKLKRDEKKDDVPTCSGLLRVFEEVYGNIVEIDTMVLKTPNCGDKSASVLVKVSYIPFDITKDEDSGETSYDPGPYNLRYVGEGGTPLSMSSAADVFKEDMEEPFNQHLVSSAETRALSRALKRILNIKGVTYEEVQGVRSNIERASSAQIQTLTVMCDSLGVDVDMYLASKVNSSKDQVGKLPEQVVSELIGELNAWENNPSQIPQLFKKETK